MLSEWQKASFWSRVRMGSMGHRGAECWMWIGGFSGEGYGSCTFDGTTHAAHRLAYELLVGPIPEGLYIDHLCRTRGCVNPRHMQPVTNAENIRRGIAADRNRELAAARMTCGAGHPWDEDNTAFAAGRRSCRTCQRLFARSKAPLQGKVAHGPLRSVVERSGRRVLLVCGHTVDRGAGRPALRCRCPECDEALAF